MSPSDSSETDQSRLSGMSGRDFVKAFPATSGTSRESTHKVSTSVVLQKTSDTLSSWWSGTKAWGKRQTDELRSGKAMLKMKQQIAERVNGASRTVDNELDAKINEVKEAEHDLKVLIEMTKEVTDCTTKMVEAQLGLSACFSHLSTTTSGAAPELAFHQRLQDLMAKNSAGLIEALSYFQAETDKFIKTKMSPAWKATADYEDARIAYDANRLSYEALKDTESSKLPAAETKFLESYNGMSDSRTIAMDALCLCEANKVEMFQSQLQGLSNAVNMFILGNHGGLEDALEKLQKTKLALANAPQTVRGVAVPSQDAAPY